MKLTYLVLNCQDLYVFMDKYNGEDLETLYPPKWQLMTASFFPNKSLEKLIQLAQMFNTLSPDILLLVEVGGKESLENFNKYFLFDQYDVFLEPSNSDRGIDLGYMVKKNIPISAKLISHTNNILKNKKRFARGAFELQLFKDGVLFQICLLVHLKSKLNLRGEDFEGRDQRSAEVDFITKWYDRTKHKNKNIPIIVSGDFNGVIYGQDTEEELLPLINKTPLKDVFEVVATPLEKRLTYCYFNQFHHRFPQQLDYFLISPELFDKTNQDSAKVLGFDAPYLDTYTLPDSLLEKRKLPSDHYPLFIEISYT